MKPCCIFLYKYTKQNRFLNQSVWKNLPKTIMYKKLMYICNSKWKWKIHNYTREFKHHHHEIAGGKRQDVRLWNHSKVKAITAGELNITEGALYPACINWGRRNFDVEIAKSRQSHAQVL
jgi:hypothetical protein